MGERFVFVTLLCLSAAQWHIQPAASRRLSQSLTSAPHTPLLSQNALMSALRRNDDAAVTSEDALQYRVSFPRRTLLQGRSPVSDDPAAPNETSRPVPAGTTGPSLQDDDEEDDGFAFVASSAPTNQRRNGICGGPACSSDDDDDGNDTCESVRQAFFDSCDVPNDESCCDDLEAAGILDLRRSCFEQVCSSLTPFGLSVYLEACFGIEGCEA